jgi:hypothetical protein
MMNVLRGLTKQGASGWLTAVSLVVFLFVGGVSATVGVICLTWWIIVVHTFGGPGLDYLGGLGILVLLLLTRLLTMQIGSTPQEGK